jgi:hypothetical protein
MRFCMALMKKFYDHHRACFDWAKAYTTSNVGHVQRHQLTASAAVGPVVAAFDDHELDRPLDLAEPSPSR